MPHNIKLFRTVWPVVRKQHPLCILDSEVSRRRRLLVPTGNYVILKRFSAKEETRRLTAGCLLRRQQKTVRIGIENHLNYVYHVSRGLTEDETFGIAALFNSMLLDRYFRLISGNTQVNAADIRRLHFPSLDRVAEIGSRVRRLSSRDLSEVESIVLNRLRVKSPVLEHLLHSVSADRTQ
jgi:adenine-specific DNA-methyltransferase